MKSDMSRVQRSCDNAHSFERKRCAAPLAHVNRGLAWQRIKPSHTSPISLPRTRQVKPSGSRRYVCPKMGLALGI